MSIEIKLPDGLNKTPFELSMLFAIKLFDEGLITSGQGATMVGLSKQAFIEMLGKYKVSIFQYDFDEIEEDIANA
jgi:predicted HTH domain antitoxin